MSFNIKLFLEILFLHLRSKIQDKTFHNQSVHRLFEMLNQTMMYIDLTPRHIETLNLSYPSKNRYI